MLNTYRLTIRGMKKASGNTWNTHDSNHYFLVHYNMEDGEVWTTEHVGNGSIQHDNKEIITVARTSRHMTMQEIADAVAEAVNEWKFWNK